MSPPKVYFAGRFAQDEVRQQLANEFPIEDVGPSSGGDRFSEIRKADVVFMFVWDGDVDSTALIDVGYAIGSNKLVVLGGLDEKQCEKLRPVVQPGVNVIVLDTLDPHTCIERILYIRRCASIFEK